MKAISAVGTGLSKLLAFVFAILFIVVTLVVPFAFHAEHTLLNAAIYKQALLQQHFYERLPALAAAQAVTQAHYDPCRDNPTAVENPEQCQGSASQPQEGGAPPFMKNISQPQLERILTDLLPPDLLQTQIESALDQIFAYLNAPEGAFRVSLSLVDLKQRIAGEPGIDAILTLIDSLPACTADQLAAGGGAITEGLPQCRPPSVAIETMKPQIQAQLQQVVKNIPDEVSPDLGQGLSGTVGGGRGANPGQVYRLVRLGFGFSPLLSVALLGLVTLFGVRSVKGWARWWGWPLLIVALILVPLTMLAVPTLGLVFTNRALPALPAYYSRDFARALFDLSVQVIQAFLAPVQSEGLVMGVAGLALVITSFFVKVEPKTK